MTQNKKENQHAFMYVFSLNDTDIEDGLFDSVEELIQYAQASWDSKDGNPFDEDCDYSGLINIMVANILEPYEFAPSLRDIASQMSDKFYDRYCSIDDADVYVSNSDELEKEWEAFVNKHFNLPINIVSDKDIGTYDLLNRKWVKKNQ